MIDIKALRKGQRIIRHWSEGETKTSDFIVTNVDETIDGWVAYADYSDDDYTTTIQEKDQDKYEYGRRRWDRKPKTAKEIKESLK